jgi:hypothetical protein
MMAGRKNRYYTVVRPKLDKITEWSAEGCTEATICKMLGISVSGFANYKLAHEELVNAIEQGRQDLASKARGALVKKALGFHEKESEVITKDKGGDIETTTKVTTKYYAPDTGAIHLLLKNYDKENWSNDWAEQERKAKETQLKEEALKSQNWAENIENILE